MCSKFTFATCELTKRKGNKLLEIVYDSFLLFSDIEPYEKVEIKVILTAKKPGVRTVTASLDSKDLPDITGFIEIQVEEAVSS